MALSTPLTTNRSVPLLPCCVYGAGFAFLLFGLLRQGWISHPLLDRYILGHPVSVIETLMFCIGATALILKAIQLIKERQQLGLWSPPSLDEAPATLELHEPSAIADDTIADPEPAVSTGLRRGLPPTAEMSDSESERAQRFLAAIDQQPPLVRNGSLNRRIREALRFVHSRQSSVGLDDQLKHLANQEADHQHESYALIRLMVWAIPMLGFLGTVLGISEALGGLNLGADADLSALIGNLKSSLYIAFDTTALALTYGIGLMFVQFGLDRFEKASLQRIDEATDEFMFQNFSSEEAIVESPGQAISRMGQALLKATFSLVEHQHDLWSESLSAAQEAWIAATENSTAQSEISLRNALTAAGAQMAETLTQALGSAELQLQNRAQQWQVSLSDSTRVLAKFQENAATHIQLLEQFFQQNTQLTQHQQASMDQLVSKLDQWIVQQGQTEAHWQIERERLAALEHTRQAEMEVLTSSQANQVAQIARERAQIEARLAAEVTARMAAEERARADAEARLAAEGLVTAEAAARRIAEQHTRAALEAKQRAEELAQAALTARKLAERQVALESENRQLRAAHAAPPSPTIVESESEIRPAATVNATSQTPIPDIAFPTMSFPLAGKLGTPTPVDLQFGTDQVASEARVATPEIGMPDTAAGPIDVSSFVGIDPLVQPAERRDSVTEVAHAGLSTEQGEINRHVRSSLLPFPDAKICRAA